MESNKPINKAYLHIRLYKRSDTSSAYLHFKGNRKMSVTYGSQGLVETDDGSNSVNLGGGSVTSTGGLVLTGSRNVIGVTPGRLYTTVLSGTAGNSPTVQAKTPGFYFVHNQSTCSIAKASDVPGAEYTLSVYWGGTSNCVVTASAYTESKNIVFVTPHFGDNSTGSFGSAAGVGSTLKIHQDGSVVLKSDGFYWLVMAASGSITLGPSM